MGIAQNIQSMVEPTLLQNGFEVVDVQYLREGGRWVLRFFIDKTDQAANPNDLASRRSSVTLEDCENVSHMIELLVDSSELLTHSYSLEVSSPGVNRPLKKEMDYRKHLGENVKVACWSPLTQESPQRNFSGILLSCEGNQIEVLDLTSGKVQIPIDAIAKAHLDIL
ncbi:MAG: ribosome maturation factor RimP [Elusimicrobia bacterium]|nr:ribosome maturation factor RimP [Elusimicrobiota bacterium]